MLTAVQVEEWIGHPVTATLREILEERVAWLGASKQDVFFPGEPERTQEAIIELNARIVEASELIERLLDRETFEYVEESFSGERKRDLPDGIPVLGEGGHY